MNRGERSAQIWALLTLCARNRQTLTYEMLGTLIGYPHFGLGGRLEPIQSYCILSKLPALSSLVVGVSSGTPGHGFIAAEDVPAEQAKVYAHPWLESAPPTAEQLEAAVVRLPSNGKSLQQLVGEAQSSAC